MALSADSVEVLPDLGSCQNFSDKIPNMSFPYQEIPQLLRDQSIESVNFIVVFSS